MTYLTIEEAWQAFRQQNMRLDVVVLDHTYGPEQTGSDHLSANQRTTGWFSKSNLQAQDLSIWRKVAKDEAPVIRWSASNVPIGENLGRWVPLHVLRKI